MTENGEKRSPKFNITNEMKHNKTKQRKEMREEEEGEKTVTDYEILPTCTHSCHVNYFIHYSLDKKKTIRC